MRIAITGFGGLDQPDSGLSVARALRAGVEDDLEIHALGYDPMMTSAWMPGVADYVHALPRVEQGEGRILSRILALHARHGFDVLIPCVDEDIPVFARLAPVLRKAGIRIVLPEPEQLDRLQRPHLPDFLFEHLIMAPASVYVADLDNVRQEAERLRFPLLVRGTVTGRKLARNGHEAVMAAEKLATSQGPGVVLQQLVSGEEFAVSLVVGEQGNVLGEVAIRKLAINDNGEGECGAVIDDPQLRQFVRGFLSVLEWRGPLELEFVRTPGSIQPWLKDIHFRFPSWIILSHWAGFNLPALMVADAMRAPARVDAAKPRPGVVFMNGVSEAAVPSRNLTALKRVGSAEGNRRPSPRFYPVPANPEKGVSVAITGISTFNMINPGLGVARALRLAPEVRRVYGLNYGAFDSGSFQANLFDQAFRLPISEEPEELLRKIREIHAEHPIDVLIPCLDGELPRFFKIREQLESLGIALLLPTPEAFEARAKLNLFTEHRHLGADNVLIPRTLIAYNLNDIYRAISQFGGGTVAVKGPLFGCKRVDSLDDAPAAWAWFEQRNEDRVIVQPWMDGEMVAVAAVCDRNHDALSTMTARKLANCKRGSTWSAEVISLPHLEQTFAGFLKQIGWVGPAEGEFLHDRANDRFYLLEINPRFTGWIAFSGETGVNHPLVAVKAALGVRPELPQPRNDLVFMRSGYAIEVDPVRLASLSVNGRVINNG